MIGGDAATVAALEPLWKTMGSKWILQGGPGAGQHTKVVNQILIATGMIGVCEALLYGYKAGLDLETVLESVASGAAGSWSLSNYGPRMIAGNFEPGFFVEHFLKDMGIALEESRRMGLKMPGLEMAEQLYKMAAADGPGRKGTQSLILALAKTLERRLAEVGMSSIDAITRSFLLRSLHCKPPKLCFFERDPFVHRFEYQRLFGPTDAAQAVVERGCRTLAVQLVAMESAGEIE